jgi:hypothetical protein
MTDSETGSVLDANPAWQLLILFQVGLELEATVRYLNQNPNVTAKEEPMREIRDMAAGLRDAVATLRKEASTAKSTFKSEFLRAQANTAKFKAFTQELKDANAEVEGFLGETGSNFPTSEDSSTPPHPDINGVTLK